LIYVLTEEGKYDSLMVSGGIVIGHIDIHGGVTEYTNPFTYLASKKKPKNRVEKEVAKREEKKKEPVVETGVSTIELGPSDVDAYLEWANNWDIIKTAHVVDLDVAVDVNI
jgi:hypothetical protein